ncbi:UPF0496 protein At4g34320-like [Vicia villosa]|uniref:UPF0496 protein At4g34320-like n=1 Tax=Vicia villosa TaxID=3911 RepID=UPI00273C12D1|nr:UPF0496 protein At4g34320-like [Vicia villosa]XP_058761405.1 UPF0496 protein At4g34320-like [Vicia villosa]XP_058761406.1 UPF0496 protein At4g34320-like [Vicia villosa]XP_058761407.1 UPF0496 protein At4g34320-like [Vicia villosa]
MGGRMSKKTPGTPSDINLNADMVTQLRSYEAACKLDSDLQSFDTNLQARTNQVINSLAVGVEVRSLSFDSLRQVTECLLEMNQEVVKVILDCKKDIWESQELFELVEEYFDNSLKTLDFCNALDKCLKRARDSQLLIHLALQRFEEESVSGDNCYARTLEELKNFKSVGDPFTEEFFQIYQAVYHQQVLMLEKLQLRKGKVDKKLKQIRTWKKVSLIIFVATVASVLICSVVAAAVASPHVAAALAALTAIPVGSMGKWIDSLMKNYENALKGHKEVTIALEVGSYVAIKDLDNIRILVNRLEVEIESLKTNVDFAIEEEEGVKVAIEEVKKKVGVFMKNVEDLGAQADTCSRDIIRARTVVLQKIVKLPHK